MFLQSLLLFYIQNIHLVNERLIPFQDKCSSMIYRRRISETWFCRSGRTPCVQTSSPVGSLPRVLQGSRWHLPRLDDCSVPIRWAGRRDRSGSVAWTSCDRRRLFQSWWFDQSPAREGSYYEPKGGEEQNQETKLEQSSSTKKRTDAFRSLKWCRKNWDMALKKRNFKRSV